MTGVTGLLTGNVLPTITGPRTTPVGFYSTVPVLGGLLKGTLRGSFIFMSFSGSTSGAAALSLVYPDLAGTFPCTSLITVLIVVCAPWVWWDSFWVTVA